MTTALAYISTVPGHEEPEVQESELRRYCESAGLTLARVLIEGPTTKLFLQPALFQLVAAALAGEASVVVLLDWSSLAGLGIDHAERMLTTFLDRGIELHLARPGMKLDLGALLPGIRAGSSISRSFHEQAAMMRAQVRHRRPIPYARLQTAPDVLWSARKVCGDVLRRIETLGEVVDTEEREYLVSRLGEADKLLRLASKKLDAVPPANDPDDCASADGGSAGLAHEHFDHCPVASALRRSMTQRYGEMPGPAAPDETRSPPPE